jgi:TonB family protein
MKNLLFIWGIITLFCSCSFFQDKKSTAIEICQKAKVTFQNSDVEASMLSLYGLTPNTTWLDLANIIAKQEPNKKYSWQAAATGETNIYMVSFVDQNNWGQHWEVDIEQKIVKDINENDYLSRKYEFSRLDRDSSFIVTNLKINELKVQRSYFGNNGLVYVLKGWVENNTDKEITSAQIDGTLKLIFKEKTVSVNGNSHSGFEESITEYRPWSAHSKRSIYIETSEIPSVYLKYLPEYVIFDISLKAEDPTGYNFDKDIFENDLMEKWKTFDANQITDNTDKSVTKATQNKVDSTPQTAQTTQTADTAEKAIVTEADPNQIFTAVEIKASFAGAGTYQDFLQKNIRYPAIDKENNVQGKVIVQFIVEVNGKTSNIKVLRTPDESLGDEATRLVKLMNFHPGIQNGRAVRSYFTLPVSFALAGGDDN